MCFLDFSDSDRLERFFDSEDEEFEILSLWGRHWQSNTVWYGNQQTNKQKKKKILSSFSTRRKPQSNLGTPRPHERLDGTRVRVLTFKRVSVGVLTASLTNVEKGEQNGALPSLNFNPPALKPESIPLTRFS